MASSKSSCPTKPSWLPDDPQNPFTYNLGSWADEEHEIEEENEIDGEKGSEIGPLPPSDLQDPFTYNLNSWAGGKYAFDKDDGSKTKPTPPSDLQIPFAYDPKSRADEQTHFDEGNRFYEENNLNEEHEFDEGNRFDENQAYDPEPIPPPYFYYTHFPRYQSVWLPDVTTACTGYRGPPAEWYRRPNALKKQSILRHDITREILLIPSAEDNPSQQLHNNTKEILPAPSADDSPSQQPNDTTKENLPILSAEDSRSQQLHNTTKEDLPIPSAEDNPSQQLHNTTKEILPAPFKPNNISVAGPKAGDRPKQQFLMPCKTKQPDVGVCKYDDTWFKDLYSGSSLRSALRGSKTAKKRTTKRVRFCPVVQKETFEPYLRRKEKDSPAVKQLKRLNRRYPPAKKSKPRVGWIWEAMIVMALVIGVAMMVPLVLFWKLVTKGSQKSWRVMASSWREQR